MAMELGPLLAEPVPTAEAEEPMAHEQDIPEIPEF